MFISEAVMGTLIHLNSIRMNDLFNVFLPVVNVLGKLCSPDVLTAEVVINRFADEFVIF